MKHSLSQSGRCKGGWEGGWTPVIRNKENLKKKKKLGHPPQLLRHGRGNNKPVGERRGDQSRLPSRACWDGCWRWDGFLWQSKKREGGREEYLHLQPSIPETPPPPPPPLQKEVGKAWKGAGRPNKRTSNSRALMHKPCSRASAGTANRDAAGTGGFLSCPFLSSSVSDFWQERKMFNKTFPWRTWRRGQKADAPACCQLKSEKECH